MPEQNLSALIQDRLSPTRVGPAGLFQPIADAMKFLLKEDFTPAHVNKLYYWLAPCLAMVPALTDDCRWSVGSALLGVPMVIADINVGVLSVVAIASLAILRNRYCRLGLQFKISFSSVECAQVRR